MVTRLRRTDDHQNHTDHHNARSDEVTNSQVLLEEIPRKDAIPHDAYSANGCDDRGRCETVCKQVADLGLVKERRWTGEAAA